MGGVRWSTRFSVPTKEWLYTLIHLAFWAQMGVIVRAYVQKFFVLGCDGSWGPCLQGTLGLVPMILRHDTDVSHTYMIPTGGVYFEVLPPNMLGTFIIGLVATSAMVQIDENKAIAALGVDHPWQSNAAFQVGIRTGLCGSITTFSSWMLEAMTTCLTGNQWLTGIGQIVVGFCCAVISFALGTQTALLIHHRTTLSPLENEKIRYSIKEAEYMFGEAQNPDRVSMDLEQLEPDLPMQRPLSESEVRVSDYIKTEDPNRKESLKPAKDDPALHEGSLQAYQPQTVDHMACTLLALLTIGACFGVAYETEHVWIRNIWLSVLFAPFGCICRWLLSKCNYSLKKKNLDWLPLGTLAANWIGVMIDYVLQSVQLHVSPGYWGSLVISSIETGFCGCLTTVSTLIAEIMKLSELLPFSLRTYLYTAVTFVGAFILGLCLLGWVFWI